jgi:hypothetical protein
VQRLLSLVRASGLLLNKTIDGPVTIGPIFGATLCARSVAGRQHDEEYLRDVHYSVLE